MGRLTRWSAVSLAIVLGLGACARSQKPVLYPNAKLEQVGRQQAERDIAACRQRASEYVESTAGGDIGKGAAVGGAVGGAAGAAGGAVHGAMTGRGAGAGAAIGAATGAAAGATAGAVRGAVGHTEPSPVYKQFVNRCLRERGYDVIGWQ
jgi:hypothetical protein